jgi:lactate dehydrogenase-like 2-hydroxyacid dehydrogenase
MAVGYNNVDVNAANKHGVAVGNTPVSSISFIHVLSKSGIPGGK